MTGQTKNDVRVMKFAAAKHAEYIQKMQAAAPGSHFSLLLQFQPVTPLMARRGAEAGGNALGLDRLVANGPSLMWMILCTADTPENQDKIHPLTLQFREAVIAYGREIGVHQDWHFLNYALGDQDPIGGYGPEVGELLRSTANKYDPHRVFQGLRRSGFKLPV
jgi:hypothetical protein